MRKLLVLAVLGTLFLLPGCGEQPGEEAAGGAGDGAGNGGEEVQPGEVEVALDAMPLEVGQWISYGVDQEPGEMKISVVRQEAFQGEDCYWLQFEAEGEAFQILVSPEGLEAAMEVYSEAANEFFEDPAAYMEEQMPGGDPSAMMTSEENIQNFMGLLSALKMVKISQQGMVMAYDLSNVPGVLEPVLTDPAFIEQLQSGFQMNMEGPVDENMADSIAAKLAEYEFTGEATTMTIAGEQVEGSRFMAAGPEIEAEIFFSSDLPILPFGMARVKSMEEGEEHFVEVRGFGESGAVDLMPEAPSQVIDIAPMVQMMIAQAQAQMQGQQQ